MPVIVHPKDEGRWLNCAANLSDIINLQNCFPAQQMNAYKVAPTRMGSENNVSLIRPAGKPVFDEMFNPKLPRMEKKKFTSTILISERGKAT